MRGEVNLMCIVCALWQKEKLTAREAKKALWEVVAMVEDPAEMEHLQKVYAELDEKDPAGE